MPKLFRKWQECARHWKGNRHPDIYFGECGQGRKSLWHAELAIQKERGEHQSRDSGGWPQNFIRNFFAREARRGKMLKGCYKASWPRYRKRGRKFGDRFVPDRDLGSYAGFSTRVRWVASRILCHLLGSSRTTSTVSLS